MAKEHQRAGKLTILVGNSGDVVQPTYCGVGWAVYQQFGDTVNVVVPGWAIRHNRTYIDEAPPKPVPRCLAKIYKISARKMESLMPILRCCASATSVILFLPANRIGTLCLLIQADIPCVLNRDNPFWQDMAEQHRPSCFTHGRS